MSTVVWVNPYLSSVARYGLLATAGVFFPPLGIGYLAAISRDRNFKTHILDCEALNLNPEKAAKEILKYSPKYVGITSTTMAIYNAASLAKMVKDNNKDITILIGGPHLSAVPYETMNLFPQFDIGVIGEGELTVQELLDCLDSKTNLTTIQGIIWRKNGDIVINSPRPFIEDLDIIPFPSWDLFPDLIRYYWPSVFGFINLPVAHIVTSRGCIGKCSFCDRAVYGNKVRFHSAEYIVCQIEYLKSTYGIKEIVIYDDEFVFNRQRVIEFCQLLKKKGLNITWSANARADLIDPELLQIMKDAGCWSLNYGIESGSQEILDFMQKGESLGQISRAIKWTRMAKIKSKGYFMIGTLTETKESILDTEHFILNSELDIVTINHFTPFPNTLDYNRADRYGKFQKDWRLLNQHNLVFMPHDLTAEEIEKAIKRIVRRFYFRPRSFLTFIRLIIHPKILLAGFLSILRFIFKYEACCREWQKENIRKGIFYRKGKSEY